jgi:hypothetical protein
MLNRMTYATIFLLFTNTVSAKWFSNNFEVMGTKSHIEFWLDKSAKVNLTSEQLILLVQWLVSI